MPQKSQSILKNIRIFSSPAGSVSCVDRRFLGADDVDLFLVVDVGFSDDESSNLSGFTFFGIGGFFFFGDLPAYESIDRRFIYCLCTFSRFCKKHTYVLRLFLVFLLFPPQCIRRRRWAKIPRHHQHRQCHRNRPISYCQS